MYSLGIRFLNQLSFTRKFQIILITLVLPILYASVVIYSENSRKIEVIEEKIVGLKTVNSLKPLRILAAKHRGNSAQWFSGNSQLKTKIIALETEMSSAIRLAKNDLSPSLYDNKARQTLDNLQQAWKKLQLSNIKTSQPSLVLLYIATGLAKWIISFVMSVLNLA